MFLLTVTREGVEYTRQITNEQRIEIEENGYNKDIKINAVLNNEKGPKSKTDESKTSTKEGDNQEAKNEN